MINYFRTGTLACCIVLLSSTINGCKELHQTETSRTTTPAAQTTTAMKKVGAAVDFSHSYDGNSNLGQLERFELTFHPTQSIDSLQIEVRSPDGILVGGPQSLSPEVTGNSPVVVPVSIQSNYEGKFYLNILVRTEQGGRSLGRAFAVAIHVGETPTTKKSSQNTGEKLHTMPAQEIIR